MAELILIPALVMGVIIGLLEAILLGKDVQSKYHLMSHIFQSFIYCILAVFAVMNVSYLVSVIPAIKSVPLLSNQWVFRAVIGLITVIKIHAVSSVIPKGAPASMKEKWSHSLIIGVLIVVSPELWGFLAPMLPKWMK